MTPMNPMEILDAGLRATLVLGLAGVAALSLRRASAASRHLVWTLGVAAALLLPSLRALAPRWELPLLPAHLVPSPAEAPAPVTARPPVVVALPAEDRASSAPVRHDGLRPVEGERTTPARSSPALSFLGDGITLLSVVWLAGAVGVALPLLLGAGQIGWLGRRHRDLVAPEWSALVEEISARIGLTRPVRLLKGHAGSMPMAWGLLRPVVLLPVDAERWPDVQRRAVLTHELAHVKRHDCLTQALAHAACAVYWFHPLVWLAARRLRVERERACDDLVLRTGSSGPDYADHLLRLARSVGASGQPAWAAVAMARPSQLEGRLLAILDPSLDRGGPSRRNALLTAAAAALLVVSLAGLEPWARPALAALPPDALPLVEPEAAAPKPVPQPVSATEVNEPPAASVASEPLQKPTPAPEPSAGTGTKPSQERVVAALSGALRDEDAEVRKQVVFSLGQLRAASSAAALVGALGDAEGEVRAQAAFALGELRAAAAVDALSKALVNDAEAEVRQQAAFALGQIRDPRAVSGLAAAVADADAEVRQQAVVALGQLRAEEAVGALIAALKDASAEVRQQAAFALGEVGDEGATDALSAALKDSDADVRRQAAYALGQLAR